MIQILAPALPLTPPPDSPREVKIFTAAAAAVAPAAATRLTEQTEELRTCEAGRCAFHRRSDTAPIDPGAVKTETAY